MNIPVRFRELFPWDTAALRRSLSASPADLWERNDFRQVAFEVHRRTQSIIYVWSQPDDPSYELVQTLVAENDPAELHREVWRVASRIREHFGPGARITKLMLAKLLARSRVEEHTDTGNLTRVHRCHLPIATSSRCVFLIEREAYHFGPTAVFEFNNQMPHGVVNDGDEARVHLICDVFPTTE